MSKIITDENGQKRRVRTDADVKAARKWDAEHSVVLGYKARREYAAHIKAVAAENDTTVSQIIHEARDRFLIEHNAPYTPEDK